MRRVALLAFATVVLFGIVPVAGAAELSRGVGIRHTTGAVTLRGIAHAVHADRFTLLTSTRGNYAVDARPPTHIVEAGRSGAIVVAEGAHVSVHGLLHGHSLRAIQVRVFPTKPKAYSIRGTITRVSSAQIDVQTGTTTTTFTITANTVIRDSRGPVSLSGLRPHASVEIRAVPAGHIATALHIHVYGSHASGTHVQLRGTVAQTNARSITIVAGRNRVVVGLTAATHVYPTAGIHVGSSVTVYACCTGEPLIATSVHVKSPVVHTRSVRLRGNLTTVGRSSMQLDSEPKLTIVIGPHTTYEIGSTRSTHAAIRPGDAVSVTGTQNGTLFVAQKVHVYAASRSTRTIRGTVTAVSAAALSVNDGGIMYTVSLSPGATILLNGKQVSWRTLRPGDAVRAVGRVTGKRVEVATITVRRSTPKTVVLRGILLTAGSSWLVVQTASGATHIAHTTSHTSIALNHHASGLSNVPPGAHVVVHGSRYGSDILAATVTGSATVKTAEGRLSSISGGIAVLRRSSGSSVNLQLSTGLRVMDGNRALNASTVHAGTFLRVTGYILPSRILRAMSAVIVHPTLDVHGVIHWNRQVGTIATTGGDFYNVRFSSKSIIEAAHFLGSLQARDIPAGARVHAVGQADSSGDLTVTSLTATLQAASIRARITSDSDTRVTLDSGIVTTVRLFPSTVFVQGSHVLTAADVVSGDDVTVTGYLGNSNVLLARKVDVHRKLEGFDSTIVSVAGAMLTVSASDGDRTVFLSGATVISGTAGTVLAAGFTVHITGYLRGDGVVLATRVRILHTPKP